MQKRKRSYSGNSCGACRWLKRKCPEDCVVAPHFGYEGGVVQFAAVHDVFGASNFKRRLSELPSNERAMAVRSFVYEAMARVQNPVMGCVDHVLSLRKQVEDLKTEVSQLKRLLAIQHELNAVTPEQDDGADPSSAAPERYDPSGGISMGGTQTLPSVPPINEELEGVQVHNDQAGPSVPPNNELPPESSAEPEVDEAVDLIRFDELIRMLMGPEN